MITVCEHYRVRDEHRASFDEYCRRLLRAMAARHGCIHQCLGRACGSGPADAVYSTWRSLQDYRTWSRSAALRGVALAAGWTPARVPGATRCLGVAVIDGAGAPALLACS